MSDSDLLYGKAQGEVDELVRHICSYKASVLGKPGDEGSKAPSGSGVMVSGIGNTSAVLTARHVLIASLLSGEVTAGRSSAQGNWTVEPSQILCLGPFDSAVLVFGQADPQDPTLESAVWAATATPLKVGDPVVMLGTPGAWRNENAETRHSKSTALPYVTHVVGGVREGHPFVCEVGDNPKLPAVLDGMSGGAVHAFDGRFLGILVEESRGANRNVKVLPTSCLKAYRSRLGRPLLTPYPVTSRTVAVEYEATYRNIKQTRVRALANLHEPKDCIGLSNPSGMVGRGRLYGFQLLIPKEASRYRVATEAWFEWDPCELEHPWLEPLGEQVAKILGAGELDVKTIGPIIVSSK